MLREEKERRRRGEGGEKKGRRRGYGGWGGSLHKKKILLHEIRKVTFVREEEINPSVFKNFINVHANMETYFGGGE